MSHFSRILSFGFLILAGLLVGCGAKDPTVLTPEVAVVRIEAQSADHAKAQPSRGFLVSADGLIVTTLHGIDGAQDITVTRNNGDKLFADFVQGDKDADVAIIRVHAKELPFLKLFTDDVEPGMHVRLLGTAGLTNGVFDHWENLGKDMNVTTPMLPTDSGAPLLADDGRVLGIARGVGQEKDSASLATPIFRVLKMMPSIEHSFLH